MSTAIHVLLSPPGPVVSADTANAIAASPIWQSMGQAALVMRPSTGALSAIGDLDAADRARLEYLARWLPEAQQRLTYLDYGKVTRAVEDLADQMQSRFGDDVRDFDYVAIPRGGLIVMGMLSYALGLDGTRLRENSDATRPLVIVDDCSLTGNRFKRFLEEHNLERDVIFAHLCSHPDLRERMVSDEPRLIACLAAIDLQDFAPKQFGSDYDDWKRDTISKAGKDRYWIGITEDVAFPWSEPDHNFWNPVTEKLEWGWMLVPPDKCLKNRGPADQPPIPIIEFSPSPGEVRIADSVLASEWNGVTHVLDAATGVTLTLEAVAADIWRGIVEGCRLGETVSHLVASYDVDYEVARADCIRLVEQLQEIGILEWIGPTVIDF